MSSIDLIQLTLCPLCLSLEAYSTCVANSIIRIKLCSTSNNILPTGYFSGGSNSESRWEPELQRIYNLQPCVTVSWTLFAGSSRQPRQEEGEADTHHQQEVCSSLHIGQNFNCANQIGLWCVCDVMLKFVKKEPSSCSVSKTCAVWWIYSAT